MPSVKIAAIVVNYRTPELTLRCVTALLSELRTSDVGVATFRIVIVDNASGDHSLEVLHPAVRRLGWSPHVTLIEAPRNGGLSYGINLALGGLLADSDPPNYVWNINPDAVPEPGAASALLAVLERDPHVGIVGSRVLSMDGRVIGGAFRALSLPSELMREGSVWPLTRIFRRSEVHPSAAAESGEVDWVPGCSMVIRRQVFEDVGLFDEGFFLYFEETDFCRRAQRVGWRIWYSAEGAVRHEGSAATGMTDLSRPMPDYWFESRRRYYRKHHGLAYAGLCETAALAGVVIGQVRGALAPREPRRPQLLRDSARHALASASDWSALNPDDVGSTRSSDNDHDLSFTEVVAEDFETHGRDLTEAGFWALLAHRLGTHAARQPLGQVLGARLGGRALATAVDWVWGIHLAETTHVGRRVRIWHSGCIVLEARELGDDVQLRHNTTIGPVRGDHAPRGLLPVIGARAEIGAGACILGEVVVGEDAHVGANSVVMKDVPPHTRVLGVPARPIPI